MKPGPAKYETLVPITQHVPSIPHYGTLQGKVPPAQKQSYMTTELSVVASARQHRGMFRPLDLITVPTTSCKGKDLPLQA